MKKNFLYSLLLIVIGLAVYYFIIRKGNSTLPINEKNFAVDDTAGIGKIFIADMEKKSVTLERNSNGVWTVNDKYEVRPDAISLLLKTIRQLSIKYPVATAARNNVLKSMATNNCKVEIYDLQNNLITAYYVGGGTNDFNGTYMKTVEGENPYVVSVPGFHGVLTVRYITDIEQLRSRSIFNLPLNQLKEVSVYYTEQADSSYRIKVIGVDSFQLINYQSGKQVNPKLVSKDRLNLYLSLFRFINAEGYENNNKKKDSILMQKAFCEINVVDIRGTIYKATCYYKPVSRETLQQFSNTGAPMAHDVAHYYATINNGNDFVLIQQFHFGRLFQTIGFFYMKTSERSNKN